MLIASSLAVAGSMTVTAAQTINVGPNSSYKTIQSAINGASAGDTIIVNAGTYYENIVVSKAVTLKAAPGAKVIVDAGKKLPAFRVRANAWIEGFTVRNGGPSYSGIYVSGSGATIVNNKISGSGWGIFVTTGSGNTIRGNTVTGGTTAGICLRSTKSNTVTRNVVTSSGRGLRIEGTSSGNTIYLNNFNNGYSVSGVTNTYYSPEPVTYTYRGSTFTRTVGNFWANFQGTDNNGDGVSGTIYTKANIVDRAPLMVSQSNFITGGSATPTPAPTATPRPTVAPTPKPTVAPTPTPTATPKPTIAPTPVPTATPRPTVTPTPTPGLPYSGVSIGFYETRAGIQPYPSADYWYNAGKDASSKFSGSTIGSVLVVGYAWPEGVCHLTFPSSTQYSSMDFAPVDQYEEYLNYYDSRGSKVILQIEPGNADINTLIRLILDRYSKHPCVAGIGIDVEFIRWTTYGDGKPVTDQEASQWYSLVSSYNKDYKLALTHWVPSKMPPTYRTGLYFLYDGQLYGSLDSMKNYYTGFANSFPNNPVGLYIGFPNDRSWWSQYSDPYYTMANMALTSAKNTKGVYWVSYSVRDIY